MSVNIVRHLLRTNRYRHIEAERDMLLFRMELRHDSLTVGMSSDAMVVAALTGKRPSARPWDNADFDRCVKTYFMAPPHVRRAMEPILVEFAGLLESEDKEVELPC